MFWARQVNYNNQSRKIVGKFKKAYFHRPIKFLHFLTPARIQKCLTTSKYFNFFNNEPPASWVAYITSDFLTCYSCSYYSSMPRGKLPPGKLPLGKIPPLQENSPRENGPPEIVLLVFCCCWHYLTVAHF